MPPHVLPSTSVGLGPDGPMASTSMSSMTPISPASLFKDALHTIFTFLPLKEFVCTCQVNALWYTAGQTMKPRKDELVNYRGSVLSLIRSPLRIHVNRLDIARVNQNGLILLHDGMGHLTELKMAINLDKRTVTRFASPEFIRFHPHLERLTLLFLHVRWSKIEVVQNRTRQYFACCMNQIAAEATSLLKLTVELDQLWGFEHDKHGLDFPHVLKNRPTLTELRLRSQFDQNKQIDLIKSLPSIRSWVPPFPWSANALQRLVDGVIGPPRFLEDLGPLLNIDSTMTNYLRKIPSLTKSNITFLRIPDPNQLLPYLPRLTDLSLICWFGVDVEHLSTALGGCVSLTSLFLDHHELTHHHLNRFLPYLSSLVSLSLAGCTQLISLEFLTTSKTTLRTFELYNCLSIPLMEYDHLRAIASSLQILVIEKSCAVVFDHLQVARWTPDSPEFSREKWPRLQQFTLVQELDTNNQPTQEEEEEEV